RDTKQFPRHRRQNEKRDEKTHPAVGDERARKHDGEDRVALPELAAHEMGDGLHRSAVVHELAEQRTEQKYREELRDELRSAAHESLRPMGEQRLSGESRGDERDDWRKEQHAPSAERDLRCHALWPAASRSDLSATVGTSLPVRDLRSDVGYWRISG